MTTTNPLISYLTFDSPNIPIQESLDWLDWIQTPEGRADGWDASNETLAEAREIVHLLDKNTDKV